MQRSEVIGALGPTNTGKTHRAIERMLDFDSGMMGLPLRLLAREVYDKVQARVGAQFVALITGEEKRIPPLARYFVCTVEAMPIERQVDFLAVDEIQLAGHRERGHVFTDRLLNARGVKETWFMGSETMISLATELVPTIQIKRFPRLSSLASEGSFTLGSLPRRSVVVAFSAKRVYELAEKIRARKGGAAIVLGGLSPRARNAQVEMYQSGEVDYLVATDAIGMGLNLDIDRVAFADIKKFDGREWRELELGEIAQIAGRAGRYTKDGTFGTFAREPLPRKVEQAIEAHRFPAQRRLVWRRSDLDFSSPSALVASLEEHPKRRMLELVEDPEDTRTLKKLLRRDDVMALVTHEERLRLLWGLCQIPDYRQLLVDEHSHLVFEIFQLICKNGRVPVDFVQHRLDQLARHTGDVDTITARVSFTRTWNYVANQEAWVERPGELQERTKLLEDQLSDALHLALLERFVARRKMGARTRVGQRGNSEAKRDFSAQLRALQTEILRDAEPSKSVVAALNAEHSAVSLDLGGALIFGGTVLGSLRKGRSPLEPAVRVAESHIAAGLEERLGNSLRAWVRDEVRLSLGPLAKGVLPEETAASRGILYQLRAGWGVVSESEIRGLVSGLGAAERLTLENGGIVFGGRWCFARSLLEADAIRRRARLLGPSLPKGGDSWPFGHLELAGAPLLPIGSLSASTWQLLGYARVGTSAVRVDLLEELVRRRALARDEFEQAAAQALSCSAQEAKDLAQIITGRRRKRRRKRATRRDEGRPR